MDELVQEGQEVGQEDCCSRCHHEKHAVGGKNDGARDLTADLMNRRLQVLRRVVPMETKCEDEAKEVVAGAED